MKRLCDERLRYKGTVTLRASEDTIAE